MIKILIVDDQNFTLQALQVILETEPDFEVTGKVTSGYEAIEHLEQTKVDITIVDLEMPEMNGLTLTKIFRQRFPDTKVIILSSNDDESNINSAVELGARGYLLKNTSSSEIIDTIRAVQRGYFQLGPGLFEKLLYNFLNQKETVNNSKDFEKKYVRLMIDLEEKIMSRNETARLETHQELEREIENLKQEFRGGLENFQYQVSNQLQNGIEAANNKLRDSIPNIQKIETQIDHRNLERQRYINTLFAGNKQAIKKLENKVNFIQYFVIIITIIFFLTGTVLLLN